VRLEFNARAFKAASLLLWALVVCAKMAFAVDPAVPSSVDVYWKSTRAIAAPGVTSVVILDEEVAHAQLGNDTIEFVGISRGETVALAYVRGSPVSIVVHVIEHPSKVIPPSLLRREQEMAQGVIGSDFQISSGSSSNFEALNSLAWAQRVGDTRLDVSSLVEDNSQFGRHATNLRTGSISYRTPNVAVSAIDFNQSLTGALAEDYINNFSSPGISQLRGAGVTLDRGKNEYSFFAGSTIPYYFLSLYATRDVAGFSFHRRETEKLNLFGSTDYVDIPNTFANSVRRQNYAMQNAGLSYRLGKGLLIGAQGGLSNRGGLFRADGSYTSFRLSGYGSVIFATQTFPLNQLQSLFSGTSSVKGAVSYRISSRLTEGFNFDHTNISPGLIYRFAGSNDYFSPNFTLHVSRGESLNVSYTYSKNNGGLASTVSTGNRYDVSLNSQLAARASNTAQVTIGSVQDPLQINSENQFSIRDTVSIPVKGQTLLLGVEHDRVQPSLISKLNQELSLLSPALQAEFQANPTAFIDSSNFPPEIKALLAAEQPTGTTFSAATNLSIGSKLHFNPNVSVTHADNGSQANSWTQSYGYSLSYQLRPTLQLRSSLTNVLLWNSQQNSSFRTTVLSFGFQKSFTAVPGSLPLVHRSRIIEGRVFRDSNINGVYNSGEPGLEGIEVRLDDGQVATTDAQGRYKFNSVSADQHVVSIDLTQFRHPVRMTTRSETEADLIQQRIVVINFGIIDFARVMGNVFNDLRFDNRRQPDSNGMQDIDLVLDNGKEVRKIQTGGSGDFEVDNVTPGDYKLALDSTSVPPNYQASSDPIVIHVSPVSTVVQDIPVRALRSIAGRVLLKTPSNTKFDSTIAKQLHGKVGLPTTKSPGTVNPEFGLVPLGGVQIIAGPSTASTDDDGNFLLRNLPAGDLKVTIRPVRDVPDGINIPSGEVKLPPEPVQIQGATIVITNSELLPYLTREFPPVPGIKQETTVASGNTNQQTFNSRPKPEVAASVAPLVSAPPVKTEVKQLQAVNPAGSKLPISTSPSTSNESHSAVELAKIPNVASAPATTASEPNTSDSAQTQRALEATFTRAACQAFQSLGEAAQCFRQLKATSTPSPR